VLIPWLLVLPWSILFNYNVVVMAGWFFGWSAPPPMGTNLTEQIASVAGWYLMSFMPIWTAGYMYYKQRRNLSFVKSILFGHMLLAANYVAYLACWIALFRRLRGVTAWEKTKRVDERHALLPRSAAAVTAGHRLS
jgi:1,2-diacylglycerol 3-beta-glucosyltransferase